MLNSCFHRRRLGALIFQLGMTMLLPILLIPLALCGHVCADPVTFPAKAGEYTHKGWKYIYVIQHHGTRSEKRIGRLYLNGKEVKGGIGELNQEPIGYFIYFGERGYNQGWLNTLTYDQKVFGKDGAPTTQAHELLRAVRGSTKPGPAIPSDSGKSSG